MINKTNTLTSREILELAIKVEAFIKQEAGRLDKSVSGKEISTIVGVVDFLNH